MKLITFKAILIVFGSYVTSEIYATNLCSSNAQLYKEIGCTPIYKEGQQCPQSYDCSNFYKQETNRCYYNGKQYASRQTLSSKENLDICLASCFCSAEEGKHGKFTCAVVECPRLFNPYPLPPCYYKYEDVNKCCESKYCPEENEMLHTCTYEGKTVREGEHFYAGDTTCICTKGFNGTLNKEWCRDLRCAYELLYSEHIREHSIPIYYDKEDGCPIGWRYSGDSNTTLVIPGPRSSQIEAKCQYGNLEYEIGDKLSPMQYQPCVECTCNVPPLGTCIERPNCNQSTTNTTTT